MRGEYKRNTKSLLAQYIILHTFLAEKMVSRRAHNFDSDYMDVAKSFRNMNITVSTSVP